MVREMAAGAVRHSQAQVAVAVSGIAGPDRRHRRETCGHGLDRLALGQTAASARNVSIFGGDREAVRRAAVLEALKGLLDGIRP